MSDAYIGEIRMFAGNFAPLNWMDCNGALLSISTYPTLFDLIGTTYGGDGQNTFGLPDLRSRVAVGAGQPSSGGSYALGQTGGTENVTLTSQQVPVHTHGLMATVGGQQASPANALPATVNPAYNLYGPKTSQGTLNPSTVGTTSGSGPHANVQPYVGMRYIIAVEGVFPQRP